VASIPGKGKVFFSLFNCVQTACGAHPASESMGTGGALGLRRPGRDADRSPPYSAQVESDGGTPPLAHIFMTRYTGNSSLPSGRCRYSSLAD
jgi:hypothetical protein